MFKRKEYLTIFLILVTEVLGFSLVLPFLPLYAQKLGATPLTIGMILTTFSLFQFISAPIMGRLSDIYGRKPMLIISQFSTFLSFIILGFANSVPMIFLSRIVDGMIGSNATIAQAYLSDISTKENRSKAFGISGAAFGFGFLIGPAIGGYLSRFGFSVPAFAAAGVSLITIFTTALMLKETVHNGEKKFKWSDIKIIDYPQFKKTVKNSDISKNLIILFTFLLGHIVFTSNLSLYAERKLGLRVDNIGFFFAYVGLISIILRGFVLGKLIDKFGEEKLLKYGLISLMIGLGGIAVITESVQLLIVITFFAFGSGTLRPLLIGSISKKAPDQEQGAVLGVTNSIGSICQIIGPLIGATVINFFAPGYLGILGFLIVFVGFVLNTKKNNSTQASS